MNVADGPLARLRATPENPHGFRGFGPLIALCILVALIVLLAPSVAPEHIVLRPTDVTTTTTTTTTAPAEVAP